MENTIICANENYVATTKEIALAKNGVRDFFNELYPHHIREGKGLEEMFGDNGRFWKAKGLHLSRSSTRQLRLSISI